MRPAIGEAQSSRTGRIPSPEVKFHFLGSRIGRKGFSFRPFTAVDETVLHCCRPRCFEERRILGHDCRQNYKVWPASEKRIWRSMVSAIFLGAVFSLNVCSSIRPRWFFGTLLRSYKSDSCHSRSHTLPLQEGSGWRWPLQAATRAFIISILRIGRRRWKTGHISALTNMSNALRT